MSPRITKFTNGGRAAGTTRKHENAVDEVPERAETRQKNSWFYGKARAISPACDLSLLEGHCTRFRRYRLVHGEIRHNCTEKERGRSYSIQDR